MIKCIQVTKNVSLVVKMLKNANENNLETLRHFNNMMLHLNEESREADCVRQLMAFSEFITALVTESVYTCTGK